MRRVALVLLLLLAGACNHDSPAALVETPSPVVTTEAPSPTSVRTTPPTMPSPTATKTAARATAYSVRPVTAADLPHSWHPGCPVAPSQLRLVQVPFYGFDGAKHQGELVVRSNVAAAVGRTFVRLYEQRFPIRSMRRVDDFGGSDDQSMAADNTSGFNCRAAVGGNGSWSQHAYGLAVDINTRENPYVYDGKVEPPEGRPYADRSPTRKGMIAAGGPEVRAFAAIGWKWGGNWSGSKDYQHFSSNGR
ncbi:MAG: hypothetical protein JWM40_1929 [Frankiales bacterium]|nr:hypothetical protein [Frankiales bacterium]